MKKIYSLILILIIPLITFSQKPDIKMIEIEGGTIIMGYDNSEEFMALLQTNGYIVTLSPYSISAYEITNEHYCIFLNYLHNTEKDKIDEFINIDGEPNYPNPIYFDWNEQKYLITQGFENYPVVYVSWHGAMAFAKWMGASLPTEAQWEYACRAKTKTSFNTGECLSSEQANYNASISNYSKCPKGENRGKSLPVGSFLPNDFGLYDMHGNVWEWCFDWYDYFPAGEYLDPKGPENKKTKIRRGGSFLVNEENNKTINRNATYPNVFFKDLGFRIVK